MANSARFLPYGVRRILIVLLLALPGTACFAGTFTAFGPQVYVRATGDPVTVTNTFTVLNPNTQYTLRLHNGGLVDSSTDRVSSTTVTVNGVIVVAPNDLNQNIAEVDKPVTLLATNQIDVQVRGAPDGTLSIDILGIDNDPPGITAAASPAANAAGWNNSTVTVTFTCSDATSGIASCPLPATVSTDGANQVISGQAVDKAGNTASASVTLSIDQSAPIISATASPAPNAAGWNNTDVTVNFNCSDTLSGVSQCGQSATITTEGQHQAVTGSVTDVAGNTATTTALIKLDKTPPVISVSSPTPGTIVNVANATISGTVSDTISGVTGVSCNGAPATLNGSSFNCTQTLVAGTNNIQVQAVDVAGNASSTTASVAFVKPPQITITSPVSSSLFNQSPINVTGTVVDPGAHVLVNGIAAPVSGNSFLATVPAQEGISTITAVVTNSDGSTDTASVQINLDTTPPHVAIYAPLDGSVTPDGSVTVTGLVNDIVVGTVNPQQATVKVNGVSAQVANRSFSVSNIPLTVGPNLIHATAVDAAGNEATATITIMRQAAGQPAVKVFSGNNQSGTINSPLQQPLVAQVVNASGQPVASVPVVFRVTAQNGTLGTTNPGLSDIAVNTDAQGLASVPFTLGSHAGAGNNLVEASTTGVPATAVFSASASSTGATLINVDSGNNQFGVVGQSLPLPFIAVVTDAGHNRIPGVPVTFTVKQGAGNINGQSSVTLNSDGDGRVQVVLTLGPDAGINNNLLEATFPGNAAFPASFTATARTQGPAAATAISGVVLDNSNQPIPGVTMRLFQLNQGPSGNLPQQVGTPVVTDGEGQFTIQPAPVGVFKLMADGGTATRPGVWPTLEYDIITTPGQNNTVGSPIYLPQLNPDNKLCVTPSTGGTLTVPQVPGFSLTIAPGSATFPGGSHTGCVTVTPVNMDKVPMVPGFGQQPRFVVTIQPVGTMFNPPAAMTIPNVDGLAPRAVTEMYSYDHDLASFVAIGTATVSDDGSVIKSDPGVGVLKAGWHCGGDPNANGTVADCPTCRLCLNNSCANVDPAQDQKICTTASIPTGVCKTGDCVPITAKVTQVTYSGGSFHGVSKDNGTAYGSPQWTDSGDHFPVSYTSNNTVTVTATFKLSNSLSSGAVQVTGDATGGLQFQGAGTLAGDTVTLPATASTQTLANSIKKISPFQIQWKLTIDGKDVPAGASANDLYVTLHDPVASPLYETLLVIAGRTADGVTADSAAATAIWGDFQHTASGVTRADGVGMVYWHLGVAPDACQTLAGMLAPLGAGDPNNGNGSCKAWSQLLQGTYFAQGITPSASILQITADTTVNPNSAGFLVRNWNFGKHVRTGADGIRHTAVAGDDEEVFPVGQGLPNVPCVAPGTGQPLVAHASGDDTVIAGKITTGADGICNTTAAGTDVQLIAVGKGAAGSVCIGPGPDGTLNSTPSGGDTANDGVFTGLYPYLVGFDARDQLGIPGQGNPDPPGAFFNHFVVSYSGQIYDPSYGAGPFSTQLAHENAAAAGIFAITSGSTIAKKKAATKELDYN